MFLHDRLVASYPVVINDGRTALSSEDFVEELKEQLRQRVPGFDVVLARFVVRRTPQ